MSLAPRPILEAAGLSKVFKGPSSLFSKPKIEIAGIYNQICIGLLTNRSVKDSLAQRRLHCMQRREIIQKAK